MSHAEVTLCSTFRGQSTSTLRRMLGLLQMTSCRTVGHSWVSTCEGSIFIPAGCVSQTERTDRGMRSREVGVVQGAGGEKGFSPAFHMLGTANGEPLTIHCLHGQYAIYNLLPTCTLSICKRLFSTILDPVMCRRKGSGVLIAFVFKESLF